MTVADVRTYEPLRWGAKVMGLRVALARAKPTDVKALLESAWARKAPTNRRRDDR